MDYYRRSRTYSKGLGGTVEGRIISVLNDGGDFMKIALSGKMRVGKDYVANKICSLYPSYIKIGFADELKKMVYNTFGVTKEHPNGRQILQLYGQIGRLVDDLYWVKKAICETNENVVISDLRYQNEANYLKEHGYTLVRINADRISRGKRGTILNEFDISETDLDCYKFDYYIDNSIGNLTDGELEIIIKNIIKKR